MNKENDRIIVEKACNIISSNLGDMTAGYYREFYKNKSPDLILDSLNELLLDLVGPENTKKQIEEIKKYIHPLKQELKVN